MQVSYTHNSKRCGHYKWKAARRVLALSQAVLLPLPAVQRLRVMCWHRPGNFRERKEIRRDSINICTTTPRTACRADLFQISARQDEDDRIRKI